MACMAVWLMALAAEGSPRVVTSFLPIYCWTANVAGDLAQVENLLSARAEPHEYAFTPGDARKLNKADLVIVNGLGLEVWLGQWEKGLAVDASTKVLNLSMGVHDALLRGARNELNPHYWLDPGLACVAVSNICATLQRLDPAHAPSYESNMLAYLPRLRRLDSEITSTLQPLTNRAIVTYHAAFPYFARRYNMEVVGVVEEVPEVNPTPKYLARLSQAMKLKGVRAIFIPPESTSRLASQIARDLRVKLVELDTLEAGTITADAYETRMRSNAEALRTALQ